MNKEEVEVIYVEPPASPASDPPPGCTGVGATAGGGEDDNDVMVIEQQEEGEIFDKFEVTRVHVEMSGDERVAGLGFAIDCVGMTTEYDTLLYQTGDDDECEVVGAVSAQPSTSAAALNSNQIHPPPQRKIKRQSNADHVFPIYDLESEIVITDVRSLSKEETDEERMVIPGGLVERAKPRAKPACWNCEETDHAMGACPKPRDYGKVAANRTKFMAAKAAAGFGGNGGRPSGATNNNRRYHEDQVSTTDFQPGIISETLRSVMDIRMDELPLHIYKMRIFGYPPGWLEHAIDESCSGLKLYGGDTISMDINNPRKESRIKPENIISYPGYNVPPPPGTYDEYRHHGCPAFSEGDSIEVMLKRLSAVSAPPFKPSSYCDNTKIDSPASPDAWGSVNRLDQPRSNSSGTHGLGRGRIQPQQPLAPGTHPGTLMPNPYFKKDSEPYVRPNLAPITRNRGEVEAPIDERYLPRKRPVISESRKRPSSPSLLNKRKRRREEEGDEDVVILSDDGGGGGGGPDRPVVLNLSPSSSGGYPPSRGLAPRGRVVMEDSETGSSGDLGGSDLPSPPYQPPAAKRQKMQEGVHVLHPSDNDDDDDVVIIISTDQGMNEGSVVKTVRRKKKGEGRRASSIVDLGSDSSSTSDGGGGGCSGDDSRPKRLPCLKKKKKKKLMDNRKDEEDWDVAEEGGAVGGADVNSDSGGDAEIESFFSSEPLNEVNMKKKGGRRIVVDKEDWESDTTNNKGPLSLGSLTNERAERVFVPINQSLEATRDVLLANVEECEGGEGLYLKVPAFEKFAAGMPDLVLEEESREHVGRFAKVLHIIQTHKNISDSKKQLDT